MAGDERSTDRDGDGERGDAGGAPRAPVDAPPCCACGGRRWRAAFEQLGRRFERCLGCGFVRMADPPAEVLRDHYRQDRAAGEQLWAEHEKFLATFRALLARIEERVAPGRLLDVGCNYGASLLAARERGWSAHGVELSEPAAEHARRAFGLDVRSCELAEAGFEERSFDALLMHHALEHVLDPAAVLAQCRRLLRPGGVMLQVLPNYGALKRRLLGPWWGYGITEEHVSHFDPRTLRAALERAGYRVLASSTRAYREDPRLLYDLMRRFGLLERFQARRGRAGRPVEPEDYVRWLEETPWARWVSTRLWPTRLVERLGLGEELHVLAERPADVAEG